MQLAEFRNGMENHVFLIENEILEVGVHVQHEAGYSYTVGLNKTNLPEIVIERDKTLTKKDIEGLARDLAQCSGFDEMAAQIKIEGLVLGKLPELTKRRCFYSARLYYGNWEFFALGIKGEGICE